ncbi:MAG: helix-turn-helix domain-containing protein [Pseudonocardia sp.]
MRRERLIAARKAAGKSQEKIAELVGVDRTTVGTWERGEYTPRPDQRAAYAEAIGVTLEELAAMLSSVPASVGETPDWLVNYLASEQSATELRAHEPRAVFGLLQSPPYVEALVGRVGDDGVSSTYLQRTVEQRLYRQKRVRDGDLVLHVIQPEPALHLAVGDAAIMAGQLDTMVELAALPNVTLQVTTYQAGQYEARRLGAFSLMSHPWGSPRVHIEGYGGGRFITDADEVSYFARAFEHAGRVALSPSESITFIHHLADTWRGK